MAQIVNHNVNIFSKGNEFLLYLQTFFGRRCRSSKPGGVAQMVRA
jgi:hypothetical protein